MSQAGASIIDIGGESTRPGVEAITLNQELAVCCHQLPGCLGKIYSSLIAATQSNDACLCAGAAVINDVEALRRDGALDAAAASGVPVIIMHMQDSPRICRKNRIMILRRLIFTNF